MTKYNKDSLICFDDIESTEKESPSLEDDSNDSEPTLILF